MPIQTLPFTEFAAKYCERMVQTPDGLKEILTKQKEKYSPTGWMLLRCEMMDSSRCGDFTILPYGPNNTFKEPPSHPISPRGLASDISVVVATTLAEELK